MEKPNTTEVETAILKLSLISDYQWCHEDDALLPYPGHIENCFTESIRQPLSNDEQAMACPARFKAAEKQGSTGFEANTMGGTQLKEL